MRKYILYQVDAFTRSKFKGNPAGVVVNADGLSASQMQDIARELNNSETAFLLSPDDDTCDTRIRYFTPSVEVPTCGHATIAAMHAKAEEENVGSCILQTRTNIGVLPFEIEQSDERIKVWMTQGEIEFETFLSEDIREQIVRHLGLSFDDLDKNCPIQIVSTGHSKVMIGISSRDRLNQLNPNMDGLKEVSEIINCNGFFVFTLNSQDSSVLSYGRMFAPAIGINEDPVTGNANGPLGAYLVKNKLAGVGENAFSFLGAQGEAIGREGIVEVVVTIENGEPSQVKIAGEAVTVFRTFIEM